MASSAHTVHCHQTIRDDHDRTADDNAPALLLETIANFTFTARASFEYRKRFDQCGLLIYLDSDNWFKASVEYEDTDISRLGSVVTNHGHSDWATTDIATASELKTTRKFIASTDATPRRAR